MAGIDKFNDHCWQDVIPPADLDLYSAWRRETFVGERPALAIDNGGGRTGFSLLLFTTLLIKSVVHAFQRAIVGPQIEVVMNRTLRWQVFRDRAPLASSGEHVHETVYHLAHNHSTLVAAALTGWDQRFDQLPLVVSQIARIAQLAAVVTGSVLARPHLVTPSESQATTLESHPIHMIQVLSGQTLMQHILVAGELKSGKLIKLFDVALPGFGFYIVYRSGHPRH